ncbi:hypothetical protein LTR56_014632 [Elasticomyces elasticus]|nr:hypothetical protein LTR56_014632 [Elasticomyces elasticus]KAK3645309.1 hypothetical protein LTR22_014774 [Elasticomyces elasticus]KAK4919849.1 hypothetical protein LTR49_012596 [Elasticomyces elasticus]KAK5752888.1 hypothetical protein LTS12_017059 [Elasticomyces elasticus]
MDYTNRIDSPNYRHVDNNEDWLDEILAMELDTPSVAAASSEGAATAGLSTCVYQSHGLCDYSARPNEPYRPEVKAPTVQDNVLLGCTCVPSTFDAVDEAATTLPVDSGYASGVYYGTKAGDSVGVRDPAATVNCGIRNESIGRGVDRFKFIMGSATPPRSVINRPPPAGIPAPSSTATALNTIIVCYQASDAPQGRQPAKMLQCGTCMSPTLFDRRYELERHMSTHLDGKYPCLHPGCPYTGARAFKRTEHLRNHRRRIHGI